MRDIRTAVADLYSTGETFALATVIDTQRSSPRGAGAAMAVSASGEVAGSVSGGCVEGAVYELAQEVIRTGRPARERYGVSDDDAFAVGLTCGGELHVFVEPVDRRGHPHLGEVLAAIDAHEPVAVATVVAGPARVGARRVVWPDRAAGHLGTDRLDDAVDDDVRGMLAQGRTGILRYGAEGQRRGDELELFVRSFAPAPRMLVFGAIDFAAAVAEVGGFLGYRVTVCDARPVFATPKRFPGADEVVVRWPHVYLSEVADQIDERTAICVLTHDPKFDVPVLRLALGTRAGYIGAMGSRRTHEDRLARLREAGVPEERLARLRSPIGLDIGARTPEETAVSIAAELIQTRWGGSGLPLQDTRGRIHGGPAMPPGRIPAGSASGSGRR
ncbi:XdhC family protein [Marinitenerispora sediminis]|uniref:XshC-Cox1 family protein n=1 Tax=Marinitenerispora sediminis TaxID=1931232 RepID=A0A368T0L9_9ACTN|nr:XdhC family protein [Marinitenerispora sediminis]RCV52990.1 XshC-Cox1 family protein [Marinitenerispora sediminis]RCV56683.1 XshC-Cox1 family protein [Marinitenerispora sediminis]RCV61675.1 XshC-Cox1 family protein [Marinitenerispora sediminis]